MIIWLESRRCIRSEFGGWITIKQIVWFYKNVYQSRWMCWLLYEYWKWLYRVPGKSLKLEKLEYLDHFSTKWADLFWRQRIDSSFYSWKKQSIYVHKANKLFFAISLVSYSGDLFTIKKITLLLYFSVKS